ncbi:MAG: chorismate synthase, partial [Candidatus Riflebacteria bacterium]|nr:chorismate synthase [Candidatus Riflebacteria bacterium]
MPLRFLTAGESHGPALTGILEGMPSGVELCPEDFSTLMRRRLAGYGRGRRSQIESDSVEILSGIIGGFTSGSPISMVIKNVDFARHAAYMHPFNPSSSEGRINVPLPGHADLVGSQKYGLTDCRPVRERASARETAMRTALSVPARKLLSLAGVGSTCFVESLGGIKANIDYSSAPAEIAAAVRSVGDEFLAPDASVVSAWRGLIDECRNKGTSLGGTGAVIFYGLPAGLGSHVHPDRRLDAILAGLLMSIPAVRGVEVGLAAELAARRSSAADSICCDSGSELTRGSNLGAGLEGGMTNGQPLLLRFHMKPLPGNAAVSSVNLDTMEKAMPAFYRSDIQAVTAAAIVAESVIALQLASE